MTNFCKACKNCSICRYVDTAEKFVTDLNAVLNKYSLTFNSPDLSQFSVNISCKYYMPATISQMMNGLRTNDYNVFNCDG